MMDGVGDIWSTGAFSLESPLKELLDSGNYTVEMLLEQDELLQELRGMHPKLVQFFSQEEQVIALVNLIIQSPEDIQKQQGAAEDTEEPPMEEVKPADDWDLQQAPPASTYFNQTDIKMLRYPYVACEVICSEINAIVDTLVDGHMQTQTENGEQQIILDLLFSVLYDTKPGQLDDYRAGYLDKILALLCRKRPQTMTTYFNEGGGRGRLVLMKATLQHLYSHSILQLVQRLLMPQPSLGQDREEESWQNDDDEEEDDGADQQFRSRWSESPEALEFLIGSLIMEDKDDDQRLAESQNASEVLITMIQNSPLTSPIMMRVTADPFLGNIMDASSSTDPERFTPHDNSLTCSMNVLESLVLQLGGYGSVTTVVDDDENNTDQRTEMANVDCLLHHLPEVLGRFTTLLRHDCTKEWTSKMQFSAEPQFILGTSRLRIVRLIESLVLLGNANVDECLCSSGVIQVCLDLFWEFEWNSMLHQSVANLLVHVFEGANAREIVQRYLLQDCNLLLRLIDSFEEEQDDAPSPSSPDIQSTDGTNDTGGEPLPVSDDDIDAVLEQEEEEKATEEKATEEEQAAPAADSVIPLVDEDEKDPRPRGGANRFHQSSSRSLDLSLLKDMLQAGPDAPSHIPSLRKGYMGHVIIVCQALVHACSAGEAANSINRVNEGEDSTDGEAQDDIAAETGSTLIMANLIEAHTLSNQWQDFVATTLASETAIQSTPLGGFHASVATIDPLHSHRPGPDMSDFHDEDYDDDDEDDGRPSGGVIDMDDNDIEIAASMMDALNLPKQSFNSDFGDTGDYMFDDPLGGRDTFESDKEQYDRGTLNCPAVDDDSDDEGEEDAANRRATGEEDPPVMDLFAGNFAFDNNKDGSPSNGENGSNFANFDAFANFDSFPAENPDPAAEGETKEEAKVFEADSATPAVDEVFAATPHPLLLDETPPTKELVVEEVPLAPEDDEDDTPMTSQYSYRRRGSEDSSSDEEE